MIAFTKYVLHDGEFFIGTLGIYGYSKTKDPEQAYTFEFDRAMELAKVNGWAVLKKFVNIEYV